MASDINAWVQFADGTFASLVKEGATAESVTSVPTGGVGLSQVSGVEIGQAYTGLTAVAAGVKCVTDDATTACFSYAYFLGPDGKIICPVQGAGYQGTEIPKLCKPVVMTTGVTLQACFDTAADAVALASMAVYCNDGTSDVFFVSAVDATKTAMVNKDGSTIGQALNGKVMKKCYCTYSSTKGLSDNGAGNGGFYLEGADGALKGMFPPGRGNADIVVPWIELPRPIPILQNDTLSVMAGL